uniref:U17-Sparatoxin-Hju1a_1 n=1 Tax=Heteropoda jugulans TaxID=1358901 RepID=A0A4Q8KD17_9ARAC
MKSMFVALCLVLSLAIVAVDGQFCLIGLICGQDKCCSSMRCQPFDKEGDSCSGPCGCAKGLECVNDKCTSGGTTDESTSGTSTTSSTSTTTSTTTTTSAPATGGSDGSA